MPKITQSAQSVSLNFLEKQDNSQELVRQSAKLFE